MALPLHGRLRAIGSSNSVGVSPFDVLFDTDQGERRGLSVQTTLVYRIAMVDPMSSTMRCVDATNDSQEN